jgi:hypothetical protein
VLCWGGGGRGAGRGGRGARACVRACVRACTRRLTCPLLPNVNSKAPLTHTSNKHNAMGVSVPVPVPVILRDYHLVTCTTRAPFLYFRHGLWVVKPSGFPPSGGSPGNREQGS